jgi:nucleoside-diphosphate kinase
MSQTLAIIKPDAVQSGKAGKVLGHLEQSGFTVRALRMVRLDAGAAGEFYAVHKERPFYGDLVSFMTEGPVIVQVLEGDDAVARNREIMGATNPEQADEGTIRKAFGTNIERNAAHGSDSPENAAIEIAFFFSTAELAALS